MWIHCRRNLQWLKNIGEISKSPWLLQACSYGSLTETKLAPLQERRMIDRIRLSAKGGDGGNGCFSFRRSRHVRRGRADGGNGGRGGDVILECSPEHWDFSSLQRHINAKRGGNGAPKNMIGSRGADKVIKVPIGTVIHLVNGEIPTVVEKVSSANLDPWDISGTVDSSAESSNFPAEETKYKASLVESANIKKANEVSSNISLMEFPPFRNKDGVQADDSNLLEGANETELETLETESRIDEISESEWDDKIKEEEDQTQYDVAELTEPGQQIIVARGGNGGLGNLCYQKVFKNPKFVKRGVQNNKGIDDTVSDNEEYSSLSVGVPGSQAVLLLELKSIADIGLVGMPNAGKATLLGALSKAKPTVGDYAFTT